MLKSCLRALWNTKKKSNYIWISIENTCSKDDVHVLHDTLAHGPNFAIWFFFLKKIKRSNSLWYTYILFRHNLPSSVNNFIGGIVCSLYILGEGHTQLVEIYTDFFYLETDRHKANSFNQNITIHTYNRSTIIWRHLD